MIRRWLSSQISGLLLISLILCANLHFINASAEQLTRESCAKPLECQASVDGPLMLHAGVRRGESTEQKEAYEIRQDKWLDHAGDAESRGEDDDHTSVAGRGTARVPKQKRATLDPAQNWRYKYFDEHVGGFKPKIADNSLDERLANIIHTVVTTRPLSIDFFKFDSGNTRQDAINMELVAGPQVDDVQCGQHLVQMLNLLDAIDTKLTTRRANSSSPLNLDERHVRLARVLDSYGRYESGHLSGKTHSPGQYDQCTSTQLMLGDDGDAKKVGTGYCWARMDIKKHLDASLEAEFGTKDGSLMVGICLPRSCHTKTFAKNRELIQRLVDSQFKLPRSLYIDETLPVDSIFCMVDSDSPHARLPLAGKLALISLASWLALTVYATYFAHSCTRQQVSSAATSVHVVLECLDLRKSWQDLLGQNDCQTARLKRQQGSVLDWRVDLEALNPVKVIGSAYVVFGHAFVLRATTAQNALKAYHQIETETILLMSIIGTIVVDSFFVITGILMGYLVMKQSRRQSAELAVSTPQIRSDNSGKFSKQLSRPGTSIVVQFFTRWLKFAVARHLRLVPLFFLVFWFKKSVLINYFAGWPLWDSGFNKGTNSGACRLESWTTPFSVTSAFLPLSRQCFLQAWSVANDLFFSITVPPIMLVMPSRPKLALFVSMVVIAISNTMGLYAYNSVDLRVSHEFNDVRTHGIAQMFGDVHHLYTYPQYRFCSILIGMIAGYFLYRYGENSDDKFRDWPRWFKGAATNASFAALALSVIGFGNIPHIKYYMAPYHLLIFTQVFTTGRIVFAISYAVLFMRMASDWRQSSLLRMLPDKLWRALARLNYAILLVHLDIIVHSMFSDTSLGYFSKAGILTTFGQAYFYCVPLAVFLHVVYENPIDKLIRSLVLPKLFA